MNKTLQLILIGVGVLIAARVVFGRTAEQKREDAMLGFTEETGPIGTLGAQTNRVSGGLLADFGSAVGEFFSGPIFDRRTVDDLTGGVTDENVTGITEGGFVTAGGLPTASNTSPLLSGGGGGF